MWVGKHFFQPSYMDNLPFCVPIGDTQSIEFANHFDLQVRRLLWLIECLVLVLKEFGILDSLTTVRLVERVLKIDRDFISFFCWLEN